MTTQRWLVGFLALAVNAGSRDLARADDRPVVPRYRLEVGQVLNYEGTYEFHYDERPKDGHGDRAKTTIWVVDREEDGGWTVVLRRLMTSYYRREGRTIEQDPQAETITFRLFDDGRIVTGDEVESLIRIEEYFPRLPEDSDAAGKGWQSHTPHEDRVLQFERAPEEDRPGRWAFHATAKHPMDPIVLASHRYLLAFDLTRGLFADSRSEYTQEYGHDGKGLETYRLVSVDRLGDEELARLREDACRYAEARRTAAATVRRIQDATTRAEVVRLQAEIEASLEAARDATRSPEIREQLSRLLEARRDDRELELREAERRGSLIGAVAPAWKLRDLEGNVQTLARRRGEVVILDFWYRGCGPCIQAMPELKRLATRFSGRPVVVFGMNTDEDAEDARFVAKAMDLNYPTLLVSETDLARSYGASQFGFPTLVIIDQEGVIRWIHTGYAPDISERISEVVESLLGKN